MNQQSVKEVLEKSKSLLVLTKENPTLESLAVLLSFYFQYSPEKEVYLASKGPLPEVIKNLEGYDKINNQVAPRNLIVSFDYLEGMIDKVSYNVEGNKFNLIISPRSGTLSPEKVEYSYSGGEYDCVIVVGTPDPAEIANLIELEKNPDLPTINIDFHAENKNFGKLNVLDFSSSGVAEILASLLAAWGENLKPQAAKALLFGLRSATEDFTQKVTAKTFEAAAFCLKGPRNKVEKVEEPKTVIPAGGGQKEEEEQDKPQDESWLAPKIFRGSSSLD